MKDPLKTVQKTIDNVKIIEAQHNRLVAYIKILEKENEDLRKYNDELITWKNDLLNSDEFKEYIK